MTIHLKSSEKGSKAQKEQQSFQQGLEEVTRVDGGRGTAFEKKGL